MASTPKSLPSFTDSRRQLGSTSTFVNIPVFPYEGLPAASEQSLSQAADVDYDELELAKARASRGKFGRKRWLSTAAVILALASLIGIMIGGGVQAFKAKDTSEFRPDRTIEGDASTFDRDPRLHKSFAGFACQSFHFSFMRRTHHKLSLADNPPCEHPRMRLIHVYRSFPAA